MNEEESRDEYQYLLESEYRQRYEQIRNLGEDRDKFLDGWLRWIVAVAVGCLSVLIPLSKTDSLSFWAMCFFRSTCIFIGVGIVAVTIRIYAIIVGKRSLIRGLAESMETLDRNPVTGHVPKWMMKCESVGYVAFILGICCLITFACLR